MAPPGNGNKASSSTPAAVSLISGGVAGGIEAAATYPIELAKTRAQLHRPAGPGISSTSSPSPSPSPALPRNPYALVWRIGRREGLRALYRGCGVSIAGSVAKDAVRFVSFDAVRDAFKDRDTGALTPARSMAAGMAAGVVASATAVTPTERVKTALIDDARLSPSSRRFRGGGWHAARVIVADDGPMGLYRGFAGTTLKQAFATSFRMGSYNIVKDFEAARGVPQTPLVNFANGALAGLVTTVCTQPFDTIKTRSQAARATTTMEAVRGIVRDDGLKGFFRGTVLRLSRTVFSGGILFTSAEAVAKIITPVFPH